MKAKPVKGLPALCAAMILIGFSMGFCLGHYSTDEPEGAALSCEECPETACPGAPASIPELSGPGPATTSSPAASAERPVEAPTNAWTRVAFPVSLTWVLEPADTIVTLRTVSTGQSGETVRVGLALDNKGPARVIKAEGQLRLYDAGDVLVGGKSLTIIYGRYSVRSGDSEGIHARLYDISAPVVRGELELHTLETATTEEPGQVTPSQLINLIHDAPVPKDAALELRVRAVTSTTNSYSETVSHRVTLEVTNTGAVPLSFIKLQKRIFDDEGRLMKTDESYARGSLPLLPRETALCAMWTSGHAPVARYAIHLVSLREARVSP